MAGRPYTQFAERRVTSLPLEQVFNRKRPKPAPGAKGQMATRTRPKG